MVYILDVSLDYHTGKTDVEIDKNTRKRTLKVSKLEEEEEEEEEDKNLILSVFDDFIG